MFLKSAWEKKLVKGFNAMSSEFNLHLSKNVSWLVSITAFLISLINQQRNILISREAQARAKSLDVFGMNWAPHFQVSYLFNVFSRSGLYRNVKLLHLNNL